MNLCLIIKDDELTRSVLKDFEPHIPWQLGFLKLRYEIYKKMNDPLEKQASIDLEQFINDEPSQFVDMTRD